MSSRFFCSPYTDNIYLSPHFLDGKVNTLIEGKDRKHTPNQDTPSTEMAKLWRGNLQHTLTHNSEGGKTWTVNDAYATGLNAKAAYSAFVGPTKTASVKYVDSHQTARNCVPIVYEGLRFNGWRVRQIFCLLIPTIILFSRPFGEKGYARPNSTPIERWKSYSEAWSYPWKLSGAISRSQRLSNHLISNSKKQLKNYLTAFRRLSSSGGRPPFFAVGKGGKHTTTPESNCCHGSPSAQGGFYL